MVGAHSNCDRSEEETQKQVATLCSGYCGKWLTKTDLMYVHAWQQHICQKVL